MGVLQNMFKDYFNEDDSLSDEEREMQINLIVKKLEKMEDSKLLDIADHVHWGDLQFYSKSKDIVISKKRYERMIALCPELLI